MYKKLFLAAFLVLFAADSAAVETIDLTILDEFQIDQSQGNVLDSFDLALASGGSFLVAWSEYTATPGYEQNIVGRLYDSSNQPSLQFQISESPGLRFLNPKVIFDSQDRLFVFWEDTVEYKLYAKVYDFDSQTGNLTQLMGETVLIGTGSIGDFMGFDDAAVDDSGNIYLLYTKSHGDKVCGPSRTYYSTYYLSIFSFDGASFSLLTPPGEIQLTGTTNDFPAYGGITPMPSGGVVFTVTHDYGCPDYYTKEVTASIIGLDGSETTISPIDGINPLTERSFAAVNSDGVIALVWVGNDPFNGNPRYILTRRFDTAGNPLAFPLGEIEPVVSGGYLRASPYSNGPFVLPTASNDFLINYWMTEPLPNSPTGTSYLRLLTEQDGGPPNGFFSDSVSFPDSFNTGRKVGTNRGDFTKDAWAFRNSDELVTVYSKYVPVEGGADYFELWATVYGVNYVTNRAPEISNIECDSDGAGTWVACDSLTTSGQQIHAIRAECVDPDAPSNDVAFVNFTVKRAPGESTIVYTGPDIVAPDGMGKWVDSGPASDPISLEPDHWVAEAYCEDNAVPPRGSTLQVPWEVSSSVLSINVIKPDGDTVDDSLGVEWNASDSGGNPMTFYFYLDNDTVWGNYNETDFPLFPEGGYADDFSGDPSYSCAIGGPPGRAADCTFNTTNCAVGLFCSDLPPGTYYVAGWASSSTGNELDYSGPFTVNPAPPLGDLIRILDFEAVPRAIIGRSGEQTEVGVKVKNVSGTDLSNIVIEFSLDGTVFDSYNGILPQGTTFTFPATINVGSTLEEWEKGDHRVDVKVTAIAYSITDTETVRTYFTITGEKLLTVPGLPVYFLPLLLLAVLFVLWRK